MAIVLIYDQRIAPGVRRRRVFVASCRVDTDEEQESPEKIDAAGMGKARGGGHGKRGLHGALQENGKQGKSALWERFESVSDLGSNCYCGTARKTCWHFRGGRRDA